MSLHRGQARTRLAPQMKRAVSEGPRVYVQRDISDRSHEDRTITGGSVRPGRRPLGRARANSWRSAKTA